MRWIGRRQSDNIEDQRGGRAMRVGIGGGLGTLVLVLLYMFLGGDPRRLLQSLPQEAEVTDQGSGAAPVQETPEEANQRAFVAVVLADTEDTWTELFSDRGLRYEKPKLVLFTDAVDSACGFAEAAVGPFYCPSNHKVYLDMSFFRDLSERFGATGDFSRAYVIAHEVGHHVQTLLGISPSRGEGSGGTSIRIELQADCLAGVWANHAQKARELLESGDIEDGLRAASAIGDDRIQMQSRGYVAPESFTHGSSAQRVRWFRRGVETGKIDDCDTFSVSNP